MLPDRTAISRLRRLPAVLEIARAWRSIAPRRTLLACSGGADSSALVLALAAAAPAKERSARLLIAHVVHDLRPRQEALADADIAQRLAECVGVACVVAEVHPARNAVEQPSPNLEALARRERYAALASLARAHDCDAIATAHHAGDQAETVLMRLLRGTGIDGLRAIHPSRVLSRAEPGTPPLRLIRPMLAVTRHDAEEICRGANWQWAVDHTNADTTRTRAWIRHEVLPMLEARSAGATLKLAGLADQARRAGDALRVQAADLRRRATVHRDSRQIVLDRATLRAASSHTCAMVLRHAVRHASDGLAMDRVSLRVLDRAVGIVQDRVGGERQIRLARASLLISREHVRIVAANPDQKP